MKWHLIQAYRQTPWRVQLTWAARTSVVLLMVVILAGLYLGINAQITTAGLQIQDLEWQKDILQTNISSDMTNLASLSSNAAMEQRIKDQEYLYPGKEDVLYLYIPGYIPPQTVNLAPPPAANPRDQNPIKPSYQTSIWDVIMDFTSQIIKNQANGEEKP